MQVHGWHGSGWQRALGKQSLQAKFLTRAILGRFSGGCWMSIPWQGSPSSVSVIGPCHSPCTPWASWNLSSHHPPNSIFKQIKWHQNGVEHTKVARPSMWTSRIGIQHYCPLVKNAELGPPFEVHRPLKSAAPNRTQWVWFVPLHDPKETWPRPRPLAWCSSENDAMSFSLRGIPFQAKNARTYPTQTQWNQLRSLHWCHSDSPVT